MDSAPLYELECPRCHSKDCYQEDIDSGFCMNCERFFNLNNENKIGDVKGK